MNKEEIVQKLVEEAWHNVVVKKVIDVMIHKYMEQERYNVGSILVKHFEEFMDLLVTTLIAQNKSLFDMAVEATSLCVRPIVLQIPTKDPTDTQKAVREYLGQLKTLPINPMDAIIKQTT